MTPASTSRSPNRFFRANPINLSMEHSLILSKYELLFSYISEQLLIIISVFVIYCNHFLVYNTIFSHLFFKYFVQIKHLGLWYYFLKFVISSKNMPYPFVGSLTSTCVTAPIIFPSCRIGLPDSPCTIPPVSFSRFSSST